MKIPDSILLCLARYYYERSNSRNYERQKVINQHAVTLGFEASNKPLPENPPVFNKDKCLKDLEKACLKLDWGYEAIAGTFWLYPKDSTNVLKCNETNYLDGGIVKKRGENILD